MTDLWYQLMIIAVIVNFLFQSIELVARTPELVIFALLHLR